MTVSNTEFWGVYGFGMALGSPSFNVQDCLFLFVEELVWRVFHWNLLALGGAWFQCRSGEFSMNSFLLMFPGVWSSLIF